MPPLRVASPFEVSVTRFLQVRVLLLCQARDPKLEAARDLPAIDMGFLAHPFPGAAERVKGLENEGAETIFTACVLRFSLKEKGRREGDEQGNRGII